MQFISPELEPVIKSLQWKWTDWRKRRLCVYKIPINRDWKWRLFHRSPHTLLESSSVIHNFITALQLLTCLQSITTVHLDFSLDLLYMLHTSLPVHWGFIHCILLGASLVHNLLFPFATLIIHMYTVYCAFLVATHGLFEPEQGGTSVL